jgi:hypothetical protein
MRKLWIPFAAAALIACGTPASAQLSTASSRKAEQPPAPTSGSMHDHIERAERVVNQLLEKRPAGASTQPVPKNTINVERTQLERLQMELNEASAASTDSSSQSALETHLTSATSIAANLAAETSPQPQPTGSVEIVTVDRKMLKDLHRQIEDIEHMAKKGR